MRKRDRLLEDLASLSIKYSALDWEYAAQHLGEIARISRIISDQVRNKKRSDNKRRSPQNPRSAKLKERVPPAQDISLFAQYLLKRTREDGAPKLQEIAVQMGIKSEMPRTPTAALKVISDALEEFSPQKRMSKIELAVRFIENFLPTRDNSYDRWVSLITQNP